MPQIPHWAKLLASLVLGLVCVMAIQRHVASDASVGRRLASAGEYSGAMQGLGDIFSKTGADSGNGMDGIAQLMISTSLVLVLGSLAAGAGIGGGGLFVPIYWLILDVGPKAAVPLSKATILGGALGNFISISRERHPKANRPLIDYESSTFMQSGELLGVVFGVLLNGLLPAVVIVGFLILILSYNAVKTLTKAISIRKKETAAMESAAKEAEAEEKKPGNGGIFKMAGEMVEAVSPKMARVLKTEHPAEDLEALSPRRHNPVAQEQDETDAKEVKLTVSSGTDSCDKDVTQIDSFETAVGDTQTKTGDLQAILDEDSKQFPLWACAMLTAMTLYTLGYSFVKKEIRADPDCQDWAFWLWYVTPVPVLGGFMLVTAWILDKRHKRKLAAGFEYLPADMQWTRSQLSKFPKTALLAGITAGLLGIGGGMVIGPLFLSIGMEPKVGTSSCAFMILWTAFSGVVAYGADDHLGPELALWCIAFGFVSGQIGQNLVNAVLKKTGRPSYVVFLLGGIIAAACFAMSVGSIVKIGSGDFNADNVIEPDEKASTHLFYLGTNFGCSAR